MTSSFPEKKEPDKTGTLWPFDLLPETERSPWLDKAEKELKANFGADVWAKTKAKGRAAIRVRRAANLYLQSFEPAKGSPLPEGTTIPGNRRA